MMELLTLFGLLLVLYFVLIYLIRKDKIEGMPEPPGNLLLGNLLDLRGNYSLKFLEWKQKLGPIFQARVFNYRFVVVSDVKTATKICNMAEASGRHKIAIFDLMQEVGGLGVATADGPIVEEQRQYYTKALRAFGVGRIETEKNLQLEIQEVVQEFTALEGKPVVVDNFFARFSFNSLMIVVTNEKIDAEEASKMCYATVNAGQIENIWELLSFVVPFKYSRILKTARIKCANFRYMVDYNLKKLKEHEKDRISGQPRDIMDQILDKMDVTEDPESFFHRKQFKNGFMLHEIAMATLSTVTQSAEWLLLFMARNTQAASKCFEEINSVVGRYSQLCLHHRDQLPYTQACILEAVRLSTVLPIGVPHRALQDFIFDGMHIKKDTVILMNAHGMNRDPQVWQDPETFNPDRFLTPDGNLDQKAKNNVVSAAFGVGRRFCLGYQFAMDEMFLMIGTIIQNFELEMIDKTVELKGLVAFVHDPPKGIRIRAIPRD